jgi:type VI secretion system protein ImpE
MNINELLKAGKLQECIQALGGEVRDNPSDLKRRTFLFELLCFAGEYGRAEKHLNLISDASPDAQMGALLYRSALSAERKRRAFFEEKQYKNSEFASVHRSGKMNGEPFKTIEDIDPRIGARLEVFIAGEYVWLPLAHIGTLHMEQPRYLRDLLWGSAVVTAGPAMKGQEFGEVLLPVLYSFSSQHAREDVKLGRETDWILSEDEPIQIPYGLKMLVLDGERTVSFLEIRSLEFDDAVAEDSPPAEAASS